MDEAMIHQFITIEKLRTRASQTLPASFRPPLNYVVEVLSLATLKILDQTYKTFKGTAIRKKHKHRRGPRAGAAASTHFGADLRGRFNVFRGASPLRGTSPAAGLGSEPPGAASSSSPRRAGQQSLQQGQPPQRQQQPRPASLALPDPGAPGPADAATTPGSAEPTTPASGGGDRTGGGAAALLTNGVDFGVSHAAMYPFVTAGASFLIDVCDVITCQLFYNSDLIRFVDLLLALDHAPAHAPSTRSTGNGSSLGTPTVSASGATTIKAQHWSELRDKPGPQQQRGGDPAHHNERVASGRLGRIPVPLPCVGRTFGQLFATLMAEHEAMPLALYRHDAKVDVYYVFTGPPPSTVLRPSDFVFLLAPVESLRRVLAQ